MTQVKTKEVSGLRRWWKSPSVRSVRKRFSNVQIYLFPVVGGPMFFWAWLAHKFLKYDRRGPVYDYIREGKPFIFALWHEDTLPSALELVHYTKDMPTVAMISPGRLGIIGRRLFERYHIRAVHGSNSLRGIEAVQELTALVKAERLTVFIMVDGSRGPACKAQWGAIHLAKHTGLPIIPCRGWAQHQVVFTWTWMRLVFPIPWGKAVFLSSDPMFIPKDATKDELKGYRARLEETMNAQARASVAYFEQGPEAVADWPKADFIPSRDKPLLSAMSEPTR